MKLRPYALAGFLVAGACNDGGILTRSQALEVAADAAPPAAPELLMSRSNGEALGRQAPGAQSIAERKVIVTAELRIQLDDVAAGARSADSIAIALGGMVANSRMSQGDGGEAESHVVMRVPTARFSEALAAMRKVGRVRVESTNADDVTRMYTDLEIRLSVKREMVGRLRALLANRAAKLSEILEAERELGRAIAELEQMEGERRYLDHQIAMSTISATLYHVPVAGPRNFLDPIWTAVRQSILLLGKSVALVISAAVFITPWIVLGLIAWRVRRMFRRRAAAPMNP